MKNFITNSGTSNLKDRLSQLIINSKELKFLVGFFYFSGLKELYESIKKNSDILLKVLVGLNIDKINQQIVEYADLEDKTGRQSNEEIFNRFLHSIRKSINTEQFDNKIFYEQVKFFIELIKENKLIIRKTIKPNHAKLYIFKLKEEQIAREALFITGSSNLTSSGLTKQEEFNVEISDYGVKEAEEYFDTIWESSVKVTEEDIYKQRLLEVLEKETLIKEITPFEAYILAVKMYLGSYERKQTTESLIKTLTDNGYRPYRYQLDAIEQALATIEKYNGVILADVVGLGKTVIACSIAKELKRRGVIICPPAIKGDPKKKDAGWNMYKEQFKLYDWEVWSLGDLDKLQERIKKSKDFEVVIIDEAHRFRNQDTKSYEYLKNICRNKKVILLTATPFNNKPADILSLLKLFITPKKSSITLENNLVDKFRIFKSIFDKLAFIKKYYNSPDNSKREKAYAYYETLFGEKLVLPDALEKISNRAKYLSKQIRDVIEPVTIRRNRLDLKNNPYYKDEIQELSEVADPQEWFYELTEEQSKFYDEVIMNYFGNPDEGGRFKGAIYRPFEYEVGFKKTSQQKLTEQQSFEYVSQFNLYDFMRRLLVKRFESSFGSFQESLKNFKKVTTDVLEFIQKTGRYILDRSLLERIYDKDIDEIEEYLREYTEKIKQGEYPKNHKVYEIAKFKHRDEFLEDIKSDLKLFDEILNKLEDLNLIEKDPKIECLINNLKEQLKKEPERKIVIFSEYVDTVKYLKPYLEKEFGNRVLTITGSLSEYKLDQINKNFDASYEEQENNYDILLTTDKLSEGVNLNRSGMVINYDIPWNPVRVIQRLGRINRISKKVFDVLYIVNFFPTEKGAELVKSREIASNKMFLIHNTLGEDAKIFDIDEEPTPSKLYQKIQQNPEKFEEETFYTKLMNEFMEIKKQYPELVKSLDKCPPRVKVAKKSNEDEVVVLIKKGWLYICCGRYNNQTNKIEISQISFEDAYKKILCSKEEQRLPLTERFWDIYEEIKNLRETYYLPTTERSLEQKAINSLKSLLKVQNNELLEHRDFINTLLEDILDYGTLPDYTLRRIANLEIKSDKDIEETIKELNKIKEELGGEFYLQKDKLNQTNLVREIIVAVENQGVQTNIQQ